jgi:hypothetical protein
MNMSDNLDIIRTYAATLNDSDLARAWRILYEEHQDRGKNNAAKLKASLQPGDTVEWTGNRKDHTGEVVRVKRKKAIVAEYLNGRPDQSSRWDIPLAMLRKIN